VVTSLMAGPVELTRSETGMLGIWSGLYRLDWTEEISISLVSCRGSPKFHALDKC